MVVKLVTAVVLLSAVSLLLPHKHLPTASATPQNSKSPKPKQPDAAKKDEKDGPPILQTIEGTVEVVGQDPREWAAKTRVVVDGGRYYGYLRSTGEFKIYNVPPGSYLVEVISPNFAFVPARVDISSKTGKIRSRTVNLLKAVSGTHLPYPLQFKVEKQAEFFEKREQWNILDSLKNPMVRLTCVGSVHPLIAFPFLHCLPISISFSPSSLLLSLSLPLSPPHPPHSLTQVLLLVGPLLLMMLLPKLMGSMDPDSQKVKQFRDS